MSLDIGVFGINSKSAFLPEPISFQSRTLWSSYRCRKYDKYMKIHTYVTYVSPKLNMELVSVIAVFWT